MRAAEAMASGALGSGMLARARQRLDHERQIGAHTLACHPGDDVVGIELAGDADERHQHDGVGPEKEGVLDGVQKAPLCVGEPVFPVEARAAVEPDYVGMRPTSCSLKHFATPKVVITASAPPSTAASITAPGSSNPSMAP